MLYNSINGNAKREEKTLSGGLLHEGEEGIKNRIGNKKLKTGSTINPDTLFVATRCRCSRWQITSTRPSLFVRTTVSALGLRLLSTGAPDGL